MLAASIVWKAIRRSIDGESISFAPSIIVCSCINCDAVDQCRVLVIAYMPIENDGNLVI